MKKQQNLRKNHRLYDEYLSFLNWDSGKMNNNLFKNTDNDFYEWVKSFEIDNCWQDAIDARKGRKIPTTTTEV
jgi:hypothetical protein